ncbi:hypothetical protein [Vibrio sp. F13]|uniref:hypothetical protein n=1 Tax=Vibrio sp. F13 TaxID=2070777 RepID=UPI0010BD8BA2|nr:hypothetical protein [Vibrio sp. F13]TKF99564.1 hypothetical protein FCV76_18395 [Vibrio sp. F13]
MNNTTQKQPALYSDAMDEALIEYVKQDISGFANRYYDTGKFLFSVSSFAILATLTIKTTFGSNYDIVLIAILFFLFCLRPSYNLTVGIDHKTIPTKTILQEYEDKKKWMDKHFRSWFISFGLGCFTLMIAFFIVMLTSEEKQIKPEVTLQNINSNLSGIKEEIRIGNRAYQPTCSSDDIAQIKVLLSDLYTLIDTHSNENRASFSKVNVHLDRHLDIMSNKISTACSD